MPGIPILSILFAVMFLGERATMREVVGILISVSGVLVLVLAPIRIVSNQQAKRRKRFTNR